MPMTRTYWFLSILKAPRLEFTHICDWAQQSKMRINITKTKLVFHRSHPKFDMPCALDGIVQEHVAKLLGVGFL